MSKTERNKMKGYDNESTLVATAPRETAYDLVTRRLVERGSTAANDTAVWQALADLR